MGEDRADSLLTFWFGGTAEQRMALWFGSKPETDALLAREFSGDAEAAARGELAFWEETPRGRLALTILLDQLSRSLFRDSPLAFSRDALAQGVCLRGLALRHDRGMTVSERLFLYLPLEHAEDRGLQDRSVACFEALAAEAAPEDRAFAQNLLDYARRHRDPVARFGRFPHRNTVLGRESTPEELAWLGEHPNRF